MTNKLLHDLQTSLLIIEGLLSRLHPDWSNPARFYEDRGQIEFLLNGSIQKLGEEK